MDATRAASLESSRGSARLGTTIGKYRIHAILGAGGMSTVYAATHRNGFQVAIKVLHAHLGSDEAMCRWFRREAKLANIVNHPGAVRVHDDDVTKDGVPYLVVERLYGETVREIWERAGRKLPVREVAVLAYEALDVLAAAHARGIVHRDVKPDNLYLTDDGALKLLDFGIAHPLPVVGEGASMVTMRIAGTPAFMAPEQARGIDVRPETDIWGIAATMFALIAGEHVHANAPPPDLLLWATTRPARPSGDVARDLPGPIAAVIDRALAFDPDRRFATAQDMREALAEAFGAAFGVGLPGGRADVLKELCAHSPALARVAPRGDVHSIATKPPPPSGMSELRGAVTRTKTIALASIPRRGRKAALVALAVAAALASASGFTIVARMRARATSQAAPSMSASPRSEPNVAREALAAYRAGRQAWDDGSLDSAREQFERATAIEPGYAAAHLGYVLTALWPNEAVRRHFQAAAQHRSDLDDEDRAILDAFDPLARHPASFHSAAERMRAVQATYPASRRAAVVLGMLLVKLGDEDKAIALLTQLSDESVRLPVADLQIGLAHALAGRVDEARRSFQRCIDRSPSAMTCLADLAHLDAYEGLCSESENLARREVSIDSHSTNAYDDLARSLFANGQSLETVSAALEREWAVMTPESRETEKLHADTRLSILAGNFTAARINAENLVHRVEADDDASALVDVVNLAMQLDMELGLTTEAGALATKFMVEEKAKLPDSYADFSMKIVALQYRIGGIDDATLAATRGAWLERERAREHLIAREPLDWVMGYALPAKTSAEAVSAIAALPDEGMVDPMTRDTDGDEVIGRVYLLAGRPDVALPFLKRGARACAALTHPISATQVSVLLGEALEATGDRTGACAAYRVVTERWGAEPRSVSAGRARARLSALRCK